MPQPSKSNWLMNDIESNTMDKHFYLKWFYKLCTQSIKYTTTIREQPTMKKNDHATHLRSGFKRKPFTACLSCFFVLYSLARVFHFFRYLYFYFLMSSSWHKSHCNKLIKAHYCCWCIITSGKAVSYYCWDRDSRNKMPQTQVNERGTCCHAQRVTQSQS